MRSHAGSWAKRLTDIAVEELSDRNRDDTIGREDVAEENLHETLPSGSGTTTWSASTRTAQHFQS